MYTRLLKPYLTRLAGQYPVVTLTGPRQSGKTTLCKSSFNEYAYVNLENLVDRRFAIEDPISFLQQFQQKGVILDEIQRTPDLPSHIQVQVDEKQIPGQFILTGSRQFEVSNVVNQSLAGRSALLCLLPLSLPELLQHKTNEEVGDLCYSGFYPRIHQQHLNPTEALSFYFRTYVERDIRTMSQIKDLNAFERFVKLCATQIGQLVNFSHLANDCGVDQKTIKHWLSLLEASFILFLVQPHFKNFRKRLTKSAKLYFYDVGLASYLLGVTSPQQFVLHPMKGALFENFIVAEFLKHRFNNGQDKNLYFFRDHVGHEVDLILDYGHKMVSIEIKSSATFHSDMCKGLQEYKKMAGDFAGEQFVFYSGKSLPDWHGIHIYSYRDLKLAFSTLV